MANNVVVTISARDQITGTIRGIRGQLLGMGGNLNGLSSKIGGITAGFLGMAAGIATASVAALGLKDAIGSAAKIETSLITSAGDVATLMGVKYEDALVRVKDVQKEISKMAASLPGETAGYAAIANSITGSVAKGAGGNLEKFKNDTLEITKTLGLLAATKGVNMDNAASASTKFVDGSANLSEMFGSNDLFQKNQLFKTYLIDTLKAEGKTEKDWKKLDQDVRNKIIITAGKKAFTQQTLAKLSTTADNYIQSMKTSLFDPQIGLFGFLREIGELGKDSGGNVKTGLTGVKELLVGLTKLGSASGRFGQVDPMVIFYKMFSALGKIANDISYILNKGGTIFKNITQYFISGTSSALERLTRAIQSIKWEQIGTDMGLNITRILTSERLGKALETALTAAMNGLAAMLVDAVKASFRQLTADMNAGEMVNREIKGTAKVLGGSYSGAASKVPDFFANPAAAIIGEGSKFLNKVFGAGGSSAPLSPAPAKATTPLSSLAPAGAGATTNKNSQASAVININGATGDNQQLASIVMEKINGMFQDRTNAALA